MARCHNCGRETLRTQDWACQWCGYPLISPAFGKIDKTYQQLKEERLCQAEAGEGVDIPAEEETMAAVAIVEEIVQEVVVEEEEPAPPTEAEPTGEEYPQPEVEEEPIVEKVEAEKEASIEEEEEEICQPEAEAEEDVKEELKPEPEAVVAEPEAAAADECETAAGVETEEEEEKETAEEEHKPTAEMEVEAEAEVEPEPESEPELQTPDEEIDVVEIFKAYDSDDAAADARFGDKVIRVTGTLSLVDVKDINVVHYIRLAGSGQDDPMRCMQSLQCMFDKKHTPQLCQLQKGQVITVQGRYNGSIIAMRLMDCSLVC